MAQGLFHAIEEKSGSGKGKISAESNPSLPDTTLSEAQVKTPSNNSNVNDVYCPPLFPMGHTQGIYEITIQEKPESSSDDSVEAKKEIVKEGNKTNTEDVAARQQVASNKDSIIKNNEPVAKKTISPGSVLDLKV